MFPHSSGEGRSLISLISHHNIWSRSSDRNHRKRAIRNILSTWGTNVGSSHRDQVFALFLPSPAQMREANTSSTASTFCNCKESKGAVFVKRGRSQAAQYCMSSQHHDGLSSQCVTKCARYLSSKQKAIKLDTQDHGPKCKSDSSFEENSCTSLDPPILQSKWMLARTWCFAVENAHVFQLDCYQSLVPGEELLTEAEGLENFIEGSLSFMPVALHRGKGIFFLLEKTALSR